MALLYIELKNWLLLKTTVWSQVKNLKPARSLKSNLAVQFNQEDSREKKNVNIKCNSKAHSLLILAATCNCVKKKKKSSDCHFQDISVWKQIFFSCKYCSDTMSDTLTDVCQRMVYSRQTVPCQINTTPVSSKFTRATSVKNRWAVFKKL